MSKKQEITKSLLKSGIPLESDVLKIFQSKFQHCDVESDYEFETLDQGQVVTRTIDFRIKSINNSAKIPNWLNFAVECKYHQEGNDWYFFQYNFRRSSTMKGSALVGESHHPIRKRHLFIRPFTTNHRGWSYSLDDFERRANAAIDTIPLTWKGIHISPDNKSNDKTIKEGIYQLQGSVPNIIHEDYAFAYPDSRLPDRDHYIIPILVTTANLFVSKTGTNIDRMNKGADCFRKVPYCLVFQKLSSVKQAHNLELLRKFLKLEADNYEGLQKRVKAIRGDQETQKDHRNEFTKKHWENFNELINFYPHIYLVVNYNSLDRILTKINRIFNY